MRGRINRRPMYMPCLPPIRPLPYLQITSPTPLFDVFPSCILPWQGSESDQVRQERVLWYGLQRSQGLPVSGNCTDRNLPILSYRSGPMSRSVCWVIEVITRVTTSFHTSLSGWRSHKSDYSMWRSHPFCHQVARWQGGEFRIGSSIWRGGSPFRRLWI